MNPKVETTTHVPGRCPTCGGETPCPYVLFGGSVYTLLLCVWLLSVVRRWHQKRTTL